MWVCNCIKVGVKYLFPGLKLKLMKVAEGAFWNFSFGGSGWCCHFHQHQPIVISLLNFVAGVAFFVEKAD